MEELKSKAAKFSNQVEIIEKAIEAINNYILLLEKDKEDDDNGKLIDSMLDLRNKLNDKKADLLEDPI